MYHIICAQEEHEMREWLSWWSATLPRSRPRVRVPSRAFLLLRNPEGFIWKRLPDFCIFKLQDFLSSQRHIQDHHEQKPQHCPNGSH